MKKKKKKKKTMAEMSGLTEITQKMRINQNKSFLMSYTAERRVSMWNVYGRETTATWLIKGRQRERKRERERGREKRKRGRGREGDRDKQTEKKDSDR